MKALGHITLALAALAALAPMGSGAQEIPAAGRPVSLRMEIAADVFEQLGRLADTRKTETVRCLMGGRDGDRIAIDVAWEPRILESTPYSVRYEMCPHSTIALWHNHAAIRGLEPEHSCYLSGVDIHAALSPGAPLLQIVQVKTGVMCWFTPLDIRGAEGSAVLLPRPARLTGRPVDLAGVDCTGPGRVLPICTSRHQALASAEGPNFPR
jgi:hypothetical protein